MSSAFLRPVTRAIAVVFAILVLTLSFVIGSLVPMADYYPDLGALVLSTLIGQSILMIMVPNAFGKATAFRWIGVCAAVGVAWTVVLLQLLPFVYPLAAVASLVSVLLWLDGAAPRWAIGAFATVYCSGPAVLYVVQHHHSLPLDDYYFSYWLATLAAVALVVSFAAGRGQRSHKSLSGITETAA